MQHPCLVQYLDFPTPCQWSRSTPPEPPAPSRCFGGILCRGSAGRLREGVVEATQVVPSDHKGPSSQVTVPGVSARLPVEAFSRESSEQHQKSTQTSKILQNCPASEYGSPKRMFCRILGDQDVSLEFGCKQSADLPSEDDLQLNRANMPSI